MEENKQKLKQAFREAAAMEFADLNMDTLQPDFSDGFLAEMETVLKSRKKRRSPGTRLLRWAACIAVIVLLTGVTVSAVCGDGIVEPIRRFFRLETLDGYVNSHGYAGEPMTDENEMPYIIYSGGELRIPYELFASRVGNQEIGVLIFVDGQLQPYKTAGDDTVQYMHRFVPHRKKISEDLIFTPITGEIGDKLMICFMAIIDPGVYLEREYTRWYWKSSNRLYLQYEADPPEPQYPETPDRVKAVHIVTEEDAGLIGGWSEEDLAYRTAFQFYVNDRHFDSIATVDASEPLRLRLSLWGTDQNEYGVVFFVNHQPISVEQEDLVYIRNELGDKVTVEAEVDISDLSGNVLVYAMVTGREKMVDTYSDFGFAVPTRSYFFVCE